jgi:hypothetical protein
MPLKNPWPSFFIAWKNGRHTVPIFEMKRFTLLFLKILDSPSHSNVVAFREWPDISRDGYQSPNRDDESEERTGIEPVKGGPNEPYFPSLPSKSFSAEPEFLEKRNAIAGDSL